MALGMIDISLEVADLIDSNVGYWKEDVIPSTFNPYDVTTILNMPLCNSWPKDVFIGTLPEW